MYRDCLEKMHMVGSQFLTQEHKVFLSIPQQLFGDDGAPSTLFFSALMEMIAAHMQSLQIKKNNNKTKNRKTSWFEVAIAK